MTSQPARTEWVTVHPADGSSMDLYVAHPAQRPAGAVLVFQEIWGVNSHIRDVTERIAVLGYLAAAPDVFHRTAPRFEAPYSTFVGREHGQKLTPEQIHGDLEAGHGWLAGQLGAVGKVAAIGFCMGGRLAFVANGTLPLAAAISFYGGGIAASQLGLAPSQHGPLLMFWGGRDTIISRDDRRKVADALETAGKPVTTVTVAHADHGFFCDQRPSYDAAAARDAWALVASFLANHLA